MATTISKRVTAAAAGGATSRVTMGIDGGEWDPWGDSWGWTWGLSWRVSQSAALRGLTARVSGAITTSNTKRVTL